MRKGKHNGSCFFLQDVVGSYLSVSLLFGCLSVLCYDSVCLNSVIGTHCLQVALTQTDRQKAQTDWQTQAYRPSLQFGGVMRVDVVSLCPSLSGDVFVLAGHSSPCITSAETQRSTLSLSLLTVCVCMLFKISPVWLLWAALIQHFNSKYIPAINIDRAGWRGVGVVRVSIATEIEKRHGVTRELNKSALQNPDRTSIRELRKSKQSTTILYVRHYIYIYMYIFRFQAW